MVDQADNTKLAVDNKAKAEAKANSDAEAKKNEAQKKYETAYAEAMKLSQDAIDAHAKAEQKSKTPEQLAAEEADRKAADAHAKAAALHPDRNPPTDTRAGNTNSSGVKLNVPSSPAYAPGVPTNDEAQTVSLSHMGEDGTERVYTRVHPEMVGDFMRAGWQRV
jgi:hypothetical protein